MSFIPETIIRALCWTLLHSLWQGLILAVVAGAVMLGTKKSASAVRYRVLAVLVMGFLVVSGYTFYKEMPGAAGMRVTTAGMGMGTGVRVSGPVMVTDNAAVAVRGENGIDQLVEYFNAHASIVVVIWFIVFVGRFVNLLSGVVYAQRIKHYQTGPVPEEWQERLRVLLARLKITRPVRLLESALIKVPVVVGWLKPVILVPVGLLAQLPGDQVESILLHELAHISRRDYVFNIVQHLVDTLFFFNPALLWVSSLIRTERENCCDDVAIRETRSRRKLVAALVSFHEYQKGASGALGTRGFAVGFGGENNSMVKRVERIVHKKNHSLNAGERVLLMGGVMVLCGAFITINSSRVKEPVVIKANKTVVKAPVMVKAPVVVRATRVKRVARAMVVDTVKPEMVKPEMVKPGAADTAKTLTRADVELLTRAREHGVTPVFISEMKDIGYSVSLEQAIRLVDHGVNAGFIREIRALGFPKLTLDQAVALVDHGVRPDFIEKWKKKTEGKLEFNDYIRLQDAGINPE
jgi:beta-lactamase regulating signal transducer with metallopeptidase domain